MSAALDVLLDGLSAGLARHLQGDGTLRDPLSNAPAPPDHYAQTATALALCLRDSEGAAWRKALDPWLALDPGRQGHQPFNRFLLLLLTGVLRSGNAQHPELPTLTPVLSRSSLSRRYPSNNWALLAQLCRIMESRSRAEQGRAADSLVRMLDRWTTGSGGFIDFPSTAVTGGPVATPMAYHHKALFVATVAAWHTGRADLAERVQRLLDWVWLTWDGAGHAGGFGRSTHSLFGDACLVASLVLLGFGADRVAPSSSASSGLPSWRKGEPPADPSPPLAGEGWGGGPPGHGQTTPSLALPHEGEGMSEIHEGEGTEPHELSTLSPAGQLIQSILNRWQAQRREDGLLWLNPADRLHPCSGWDDYMHLSVYNAWAAGILAWTRHTVRERERPTALAGIEFRPPSKSLIHDQQAGLVRFESPEGTLALVATRGQLPQAFSRTEAEFRYAGGVPFHLAWRGRLLCPPPVRVGQDALLEDPTHAGWTPIFSIEDELYGLTDFDSVAVREEDNALVITLTGHPKQLLRPMVGGLSGRIASALDWRILGGVLGRRSALKRRAFEDLEATVMLTIAVDRPALVHEVSLRYSGAGKLLWLNPGGHAVLKSGLAVKRELGVHEGDTDEGLKTPSGAARHLRQHPLEASLPDAFGYCLPAMEIECGSIQTRLNLTW